MTLGYLIIAEQMFTMSMTFADYEARSLKNLGHLASLQDDMPRALTFYKKSLEKESNWEIAYQIGLILLGDKPQEALDSFCLAIDLAQS